MTRKNGMAFAAGVGLADVKGGFTINLKDGSWWWSPGMYALHGIPDHHRRPVSPSTRLLLAHRDPADRHAFRQAWRHLLTDVGMVAVRYRIIGADAIRRPVFVMASIRSDLGGDVVTGVMQLEHPA